MLNGERENGSGNSQWFTNHVHGVERTSKLTCCMERHKLRAKTYPGWCDRRGTHQG